MRLNWLWGQKPKQQTDQHEAADVDRAKQEAAEALAASYQQLEKVRQLNEQHKPVRQQMKNIRQRNGFAEGLMRVIEEGR